MVEALPVAIERLPVDGQVELRVEVAPLLEGPRIDRSDGFALNVEDGGDSLADLGLRPAVDEDIERGLAEQVDEAWGDDPGGDLDAAPCRCIGEVAHGDDPLAPDAHVGAHPWRSGPVDDVAVLEDEVERFRSATAGRAGQEQQPERECGRSHGARSVPRGSPVRTSGPMDGRADEMQKRSRVILTCSLRIIFGRFRTPRDPLAGDRPILILIRRVGYRARKDDVPRPSRSALLESGRTTRRPSRTKHDVRPGAFRRRSGAYRRSIGSTAPHACTQTSAGAPSTSARRGPRISPPRPSLRSTRRSSSA